jgi:hypothetical protein
MKKLSLKTNVDNSDANYPYGKSKDDPLGVSGTPLNHEYFQDSEQLFEKVFADSGILANNLPDNNANGYQLTAAFYRQFNPEYTVRLDQDASSPFAVTSEILVNNYRIDANGNKITDPIVITRQAVGVFYMDIGLSPANPKFYAQIQLATQGFATISQYGTGGAVPVTRIEIRTYNTSWTLADGIITGSKLTIRKYN